MILTLFTGFNEENNFIDNSKLRPKVRKFVLIICVCDILVLLATFIQNTG